MSSCYFNPTPTYQPAMRIIGAITKADPALVTTTGDHNFITGEVVRLVIPSIFGMQQMNGLVGNVTVFSDTTFTVDIDSTKFDAFSIPSPLPAHYTCAQVIPIGEANSTLLGATKNVLPSGDR